MLRIGICDDQQKARFSLSCNVERCLARQNTNCQIYEFSSAEGLLKWLEKHPDALDLLFLDIEMADLDGMAAAKKIRETNQQLALVFVTGYADYVFDGYEVGALDYLLKPAKEEQLTRVLNKVQASLVKHSQKVYTFQNTAGLYRIPYEKILYFMSERRQVILVTETQKYAFYGKLDDVEKQVAPHFFRIHRRYLVYLAAVQQITGNSVQLAEETLPISRNQRPGMIKTFTDSLLEQGNDNYV
ncbi:two-component system response regulator LytT [Enterococcus sp. PF1-24]|uniref:LytR/AlgR family response regulator transcription factor n=1 Tax=unclassified Enterococcus TaxID=2608891 RepID=UPI00247465A4|nr:MULTISPECIES: LytTR family DNA-binding domain-containing protein [unclassified Enterococcus]MDH6363309.1 two-component system response regulator LytT [Enterococcus sp. PFB1-1]MDH6400390.1 two-component system response regulator LytT [Enterococcus sp. PF1-24]